MILRTWKGSTAAADADRYHEVLQRTGVGDLEATPGNAGVAVVRRIAGDRAEFLVLSLWDSLESVRSFAGDEPERAVFYPEDDAFLVERDLHVDHWEVLHLHMRGSEPDG
jgi:heme-degrading monooxygenase HmoA